MEKSSLRDLYNSSPNQKAKLIRGVIYSFLNKLFDLAPPVLIGIAIDIVVEGEESFIAQFGFIDRKQQLIVLAFLTFAIWSLESLFDYIAAVTWRNISQDIEHELRMDTYINTQGSEVKAASLFANGRDTRLQGQSEEIANLQLGWDDLQNGTQGTLIVNYVSDRVRARGIDVLPDLSLIHI